MTHPAPGTAGTPTVRLDLPPAPVAIAIGRSVVRRIVTFRNSDAESSFLVAFTEILANAIDEHERSGLSSTISVEITRTPIEAVRVKDSGSGIDTANLDQGPTATNEADSTSVSERGRGLALAHAFIDDIDFETSSTGTVVTMPLRGLGIMR